MRGIRLARILTVLLVGLLGAPGLGLLPGGPLGQQRLDLRLRRRHRPHEGGTGHFPVLYMHDGQNLFDRGTAFGGNEWQVDETLETLKVVKPEEVVEITKRSQTKEGYRLTVSLEDLTVKDNADFQAKFQIEPFTRYCLLEGLDDIGLTLRHQPQIDAYEKARQARNWLPAVR